MVNIIGKAPIHPILFYSGKLSAYTIWLLLFISLFSDQKIDYFDLQTATSIIILCFSLILIGISIIQLGNALRIGLPKEQTELKTEGLYKISRNPIYIGLNMLTLSAILFLDSFIVLLLGIYSVYIHHLIILAEEKFLQHRFNGAYYVYKKRVRRYL